MISETGYPFTFLGKRSTSDSQKQYGPKRLRIILLSFSLLSHLGSDCWLEAVCYMKKEYGGGTEEEKVPGGRGGGGEEGERGGAF